MSTFAFNRMSSTQEIRLGLPGVFQSSPVDIYVEPIDANCLMWSFIGEVTYGGVSLGNFVIEIDPATGKASSVQSKALRVTLRRKRNSVGKEA